MTGLLFVIGTVAGTAMVAAFFLLRSETPDNQARVVEGGWRAPPTPTRSLRSLFKKPQPDPCEDSTILKVKWLSNHLGQD
jgi:hypothetical protein